jgi:pSer/pThr/pTyr-binding forkhead associated (FHA) protein
MWILRSSESDGHDDLIFRVLPMSSKTMGRALRADFVVDAALVSRFHCRLEAGSRTLEDIDLESTNGTFVNGQRIERAKLGEGDRLRVGRVELKVERQAKESQ